MSDVINITIRTLPKGDEVDVQLSVFSTGREIIDRLLEADIIARHDPEGNPLILELISKTSNLKIEDDKTLDDLGIREGDTLHILGKHVAG